MLIIFLILVMAGGVFAAGRQGPLDSADLPERVLAEIALGRAWRQRLAQDPRLMLESTSPPVAADQGNVAVLETDDTMLIRANVFDLDNKSLRFSRNSDGTYQVAVGNTPFDSATAESGTPIPLADDDTREIQLGFNFQFFNRTYTSIFLNSDGNLTFTEGDVATSARDLSRFLAGVPRIAPFFTDLEPPVDNGRVTVAVQTGRVVFSWLAVDLCCGGGKPRNTFQVILSSDGTVEFVYSGIFGRDAVVGLSPGNVGTVPVLVDLDQQNGSQLTGPIAEVFSSQTAFSTTGAARKFYSAHQDAYDYVILWANFSFSLGNAFAFEENIRNDATGLGKFGSLGNTFDFGRSFGSQSRLQSLVQMGDLSRYPDDPATVLPAFFSSGNTTLSILGQEAGHRWLARLRYPQDADPQSTVLLGRDLAHWSYYFNSEASVVEGNQIRDNGDGTFTTTDTVKRYGNVDQYVMGLRAPEEVADTFVVTNPSLSFPPSHGPQAGVTFRGTSLPVTIDKIIQANGPRVPSSATSQKNFNFAFILVTQAGQAPSAADVSKVDRIRAQWESFWASATSNRSVARTALVQAASLIPAPLATVVGGTISLTVTVSVAASADTVFSLQSSMPALVSVPASVTLPAGQTRVSFNVTALGVGTATVTATADGFDTASALIAVSAPSTLTMRAVSGDSQSGAPSRPLSQPLVIALADASGLPAASVSVQFVVTSGGGSVNPATATSDLTGRAQTSFTLGSSLGNQSLTASVAGASNVSAVFRGIAVGSPTVPPGSAVNGASFAAAAAVAPGSIISVFGISLAGTNLGATSLPLPLNLGNTTVTTGGIGAPLFFASPAQINAQVPFELSGASAPLVVFNGASAAPSIALSLVAAAPGIFTLSQNGTGPAAVLHASDGTLVNAASPARAGEFVSIFGTGLGAVSPPVPTGTAASSAPLSTTVNTAQVTMGGMNASVPFSGLAPGFVGLYQVNAQVPAGVSGNAVPMVIKVSGASSNTAAIAVQ